VQYDCLENQEIKSCRKITLASWNRWEKGGTMGHLVVQEEAITADWMRGD
jgi:hypothetical protein